jgi:hypothetical protein
MDKKTDYIFTLKINNHIISERLFPANVFNHDIRYNVDIKDISKNFIHRLQTILSSRTNQFTFFDNEVKGLSNKKPNFVLPEDLTEAFSYSLSYDDNTIIERKFTVKNFNIKSIYSYELYNEIIDITKDIFEKLLTADKKQQTEEYLLTTYYNYQIADIRSMDISKRKALLQKVNHLI